MKKKFNKTTQPIRACITVTDQECNGNTEKMVRRFLKKVKKEGIVEEFRKRSHYIKPTTVRAERKRQRRRLINKVNKKREELFNFSGRTKGRR